MLTKSTSAMDVALLSPATADAAMWIRRARHASYISIALTLMSGATGLLLAMEAERCV